MVKFLFYNSRNHCGTTVGFVTQKKSVESTNKRFAVYGAKMLGKNEETTNLEMCFCALVYFYFDFVFPSKYSRPNPNIIFSMPQASLVIQLSEKV